MRHLLKALWGLAGGARTRSRSLQATSWGKVATQCVNLVWEEVILCSQTELLLGWTKPLKNRSKRMEVLQKLSSKELHPGSHHFPFLLASHQSLINAENRLEQFLKIAGNPTMVFRCKKHRDPFATNFWYISKRKYKVVSNKIMLGSPKCSHVKWRE